MSLRMDIDTLISAVEVRPCLWDRFHADYKDKNKTIEGWKEVCCLLKTGFDSLNDHEKKVFRKEVIKRWNNIRDSFRKYTKQMLKEKRSGTSASTIKKYVYSEQLTFLEKVFDSKLNGNAVTSEPSDRPPDEDDVADVQISVSPPASKVPRKRKRTEEPEQRPVAALEDNENPHLSFCKGFLPMIQDLDEEETIDFQMGVLNLIRDIKQKRTYSSVPSYSSQRNLSYPTKEHSQHMYPGTYPRFFHSSHPEYSHSQSSASHRNHLKSKPSLKFPGAVSSQHRNRSQCVSSPSNSSVMSSTDSHTQEIDFA